MVKNRPEKGCENYQFLQLYIKEALIVHGVSMSFKENSIIPFTSRCMEVTIPKVKSDVM